MTAPCLPIGWALLRQGAFDPKARSCHDASVNRNALRWLLTALVAFTSPIVFGFDLLMRQLVVGTQPEDVQEFMADFVTKLAWWALPIPVLGAIAGFMSYGPFYRRLLAKHRKDPPTSWTPEMKAELEALFLSASIVQIPALLGDFSVLLGAYLTPAICITTLSTSTVLLIALRASRMSRSA
jgi:hypothetical protein